MKSLLLILTVFLALQAGAIEPGIETLMALHAGRGEVKIRVQTTGCTWKNSFRIKQYWNNRSQVTQLAFERIVPDYCEAYIPQGKSMTFSFDELGIKPGERYLIVNAIAVRQ